MTVKPKESGHVITLEKIKVACENCSLATLCLPMGLEMADVERLSNIINRNRPLHKGDHLFSKGDVFHSLYIVKTGTVKTYTQCADGTEQIVGFHLPGELIGMDAIQDGQHHCSASALETTGICELPFERLETLANEIPSLQHQVYRLLSDEIGKDKEFMLMMGNSSSEERVAGFLLSLSRRLHQRGLSATIFNMSMSRQEIGGYLGLALETVSRIFTKLQDDGILKVDRKHVEILSLATLQLIVTGQKDGATDPAKSQHC